MLNRFDECPERIRLDLASKVYTGGQWNILLRSLSYEASMAEPEHTHQALPVALSTLDLLT
jgi:hypothetical protein